MSRLLVGGDLAGFGSFRLAVVRGLVRRLG